MDNELEALTGKYKSLCKQYGVMKNAGFKNTAMSLKVKILNLKTEIEILKR